MSSTKDTINVRNGEELDLIALKRYLQAHADQLSDIKIDDDTEISIEQFPSGHSNLTYLIKIGTQEFVLRRPPFGPVPPTAHDMARESRLLMAVNRFFPLAPKPFLLCEDKDILGVTFYIMERRRGLVVQRTLPPQIGEDQTLRRRISESLVDTIAELHSINIYDTGLSAIGKPAGFLQRQVKGWSERWQKSKTEELPKLDEVMVWLNEQMPADNPARATIVHNDFKLDNVMLDLTDPARVVGVFDWEMSTVGDPLVDFGIFLGYWAQPDDPAARRETISPVTAQPGWLSRAEIIARYQEKTGRDLSNISYYETFAIFKLAVVLQQIYYRFVKGQTQDERFKHFDKAIAGLADAAWQLKQ